MEEEYWVRFTTTGSITDYLSYREAVEQRSRQEQTMQGEPYDGKYYGDGNDIVGTANRGI
ncbi:MAG: hypothetical protein J1E35_00095 [Lachnospiraceae bacterium]|nr:hypothetical protein [Lachnospiraceae bacterium]